jgi:hypothetical protein
MYSFLTFLDGLLIDTLRDCKTDNLPGMTARSVFISISILFVSSLNACKTTSHKKKWSLKQCTRVVDLRNMSPQPHTIAASIQPVTYTYT